MLPLKDGNITLVNEVVLALVKSRIFLVVIIKLIKIIPPEELAHCIMILASSLGSIIETTLSLHDIVTISHASNWCLALRVLILK